MRFMDVNNEKALALKAEEEKLLEEENPEEETLEGQEETDSESMEVRDILE